VVAYNAKSGTKFREYWSRVSVTGMGHTDTHKEWRPRKPTWSLEERGIEGN
jgi:hypothetical protein